MAKIKFGAIITDSRGSIGGQTIQMTRYGTTLSTKATQTAKTTPAASKARATFAEYSKLWWSALTPTQRDDWRALAAANPMTNAWGDEYPLTGLAYYIKLNCRLVAAGQSPTNDAPTDQVVTPFATAELEATAPDSLLLTFTGSPVPTDDLMYLFATPSLSPGKLNYKNAMTFIGTMPEGTTSPVELFDLYQARVGNIYVGKQYAVSVAKLNTTNAALSVPLIASAIAT